MALSYIILIAVLGTHGALKCFYRNAHVFRGKKNGQREREKVGVGRKKFSCSVVSDSVAPRTVTHQAPLFM